MSVLSRIYSLLSPSERREGRLVVATVVCSAVLDFCGLAALLPVLYYLLDDGNNCQAAFYFCIVAVSIVILKNILSIFFSRYQNRYLLSFYKRLSLSLYSSYYHRGLLFIREQGSSKLGYEVNGACYSFSQRLLAPILRMTGELLLVILVTAALLIYDGTTVLLLYATFIPFMLLYYFAVRRRIREYDDLEYNAMCEQSKVVAETFRGFTELEVNGAFPALRSAFCQGMDKVSDSRLKLDVIYRFPAFLAEFSVIIGLSLLVLFGNGDVKLLVGIFAVAAFRLLPALRSILSAWTEIHNATACLDTIEKGLNDSTNIEIESDIEPLKFDKHITISKLSYTYDNSRNVLNNFTCTINKGEYVGFRGSSGVGKSTLFNLIIGLLSPLDGMICIDDTELCHDNRKAWMKHIGYVPQDVFIFNGTLAENIALGCEQIDRNRINDILAKVSLDKWIKALPKGLDTILGEAGGNLSGGQKQRIGIARAIYKGADVLLLDEATSALDNRTEKEVNETLTHLKATIDGLTILSIAHRESSLAYCNRVITLENDDD